MILRLSLLLISLLYSSTTFAQANISYELDKHIVYYNVFNSSLIPADVASRYHLVRAKNRIYLNLAVVKKSGGYGFEPTHIRAVSRNLMQQKFPLELIKIEEATATYYLAPIRINNEDILHLDITVQPESHSPETTFTVTKKLYVD